MQPIEILNPIYDKNNCGVSSSNLQMKIECIKSNVYDLDDTMNLSYFIILSNLCHEQHVEENAYFENNHWNHGLRTPNEAFFHQNLKLLGLGR